MHELHWRPDLSASESNGSEKPGRQRHMYEPAVLKQSPSELQSFRLGELHSFRSTNQTKCVKNIKLNYCGGSKYFLKITKFSHLEANVSMNNLVAEICIFQVKRKGETSGRFFRGLEGGSNFI